MATINLTNVLFYKGGTSGVSEVVGNDWESNAVVSRVARYTFTAPDEGAQGVSLTLHSSGIGGGSHIPIRFYIGTDPDSHTNAGPDSEYTGELTIGDDWLTFTGEAEIMLLPGVTYYLWLFPGNDTFGWYSWQRQGYTSAMESTGAAGIVYVHDGTAWQMCLVYYFDGTDWWLCLAYVHNGTDWYLCSAIA